MRILKLLFAITLIGLLTAGVNGQEIFSSSLDDGAGWRSVADEDTDFEFGVDYSAFGIPAAPSGTGTVGLWMAANIVDPGGAQNVAVYPENLDLAGEFQVKFDFWLNYNTSGGTTEAGGGSVSFDPSGAPINGATFLGNTDGDTNGQDYLLFLDGTALGIDSGAYSIPSTEHADLADIFPGGGERPEAQGDPALFDPTNVNAPAPAGTLGFAWHTMTIDVDSAAGTARFSVDDVEIGTVSGIDEGTLALNYRDPFGSVASKPAFAFGVFDNLSVTQVPEPGSCTLLLLGMLAFAARCRK